MRIVVIGGVAAGMSAASQAKRRRPDAEVVVLEQTDDVSYGACGLPYNLADPARQIDDLVVLSAAQVRDERKIDLRTEQRVERIDTREKRVRAHDLRKQASYDLDYDKLVIATGAEAVRPGLPGLELDGVFTLRTLADGARLKRYLKERAPRRAVLVGAGYIGMEMAESLSALGLSVTVLEKAPQVLPGFDPTLAKLVQEELEKHAVEVLLGRDLRAIESSLARGTARFDRGPSGLSAQTDAGSVETDLIMIAVGVRPNVALAKAAGIALGETGAIAVDDHQRTSAPDVYAAGDCAEALHLVSGRPAFIPLGTTANKQGKVAGANAAGADERFAGLVGSAAFKVFDLEVGRTGLGSAELSKLGIEAVRSLSKQAEHAASYRRADTITSVLFVEPGSGRLLGAQMVGAGVVGKRIDIFATALHARMTVEAIAALDLSYAPPIAPVYDPVLIAAHVAQKQLAAGLLLGS